MKRHLSATAGLVLCLSLWGVAPPSRAGDQPEACATCHQEVVASWKHSPHAGLGGRTALATTGACAACHGPVDEHLETGDADALRRFPGQVREDDADLCLGCHAAHDEMGAWPAGQHAMAGVGCLDCHSIHDLDNPTSAAPALGHRRSDELYGKCLACHSEVQARIHMPSHHPLGEGRLTCGSCHQPHGMTEGLLRTHFRKNDLCLDCHPAMQGPHVFQHEPVEEDCMICHDPHGAPADNLLIQTEPFLCLQCHEAHFHAGLGGAPGAANTNPTAGVTFGTVSDPTSGLRQISVTNPFGAYGMKRSFLTRCTQCHSAVHGSDTPSAGVSGGGRAMTR